MLTISSTFVNLFSEPHSTCYIHSSLLKIYGFAFCKRWYMEKSLENGHMYLKSDFTRIIMKHFKIVSLKGLTGLKHFFLHNSFYLIVRIHMFFWCIIKILKIKDQQKLYFWIFEVTYTLFSKYLWEELSLQKIRSYHNLSVFITFCCCLFFPWSVFKLLLLFLPNQSFIK